MSEQLYTFFSSDSSELYKADVFKTLALPPKYVIQFRYPVLYIDSKLGTDYGKLVDQQGCIFYVAGNDLALPVDKRPHQIVSIRRVKVLGYLHDDADTQQVYFYLEMGEFIDCRTPGGELLSLASRDIYVSNVTVELGAENSWLERVQTVANYFPNQLFYQIKAITKRKKTLSPRYNKRLHIGYYKLKDESDYQYLIQFYDTASGASVLETESLSESLSVSIPAKFIVGTKIDQLFFGIQTSSLNRRREAATVRFLQENSTSVYRVDLAFTITRSFAKVFVFGFWTALVGLGLLLGQMAPKVVNEIPPLTIVNFVLGAAAVLCVGIGAGALYHLFNKK